MEIISIPQLRLAQLQTLAERTLTIVKPITSLADPTVKVQAALDQFKEGMLKETTASDKKTLDKTRDGLISGFMFAIKSEEYYPSATAETQTVLEQLKKILETYGFTVNRLSYDEQTAAIDNMLAEAEKIDLTGLEYFSRWIPHIKAANENFKSASKDYLESTVSDATTESASAAAPTLITELENLYTFLFAYATVSATDELVQAYQQLTALVDSYR